MKQFLFLLLFPLAAYADDLSLYSFHFAHPEVDLTAPLCEQPGYQQFSAYDYRCFTEIPFDYVHQCYEWNCAVPYDHVFYEPITGTRKILRGPASVIDQYYRAARAALVAPAKRKRK